MNEKLSEGRDTLSLGLGVGPLSPRPEVDRPGNRRWLPLALAVGAPALVFALLFVAVPPAQQNIPLNDDTLYSRTAERLARGNGLDYYNQGSMPMLGLLAWVLPFLWVFGYAHVHVILRVATMLLSLLGLVGYYDLLRREGNVPAWPAAATTACLGLGPLYFLLGSMFHTDVPTVAFALLALACYSRGMQNDRLGWWLGGMLLALMAVSTRQNAIAAPAAAGILLLFRRPESFRTFLWCLLRGPAWVGGKLLQLLGVTLPERAATYLSHPGAPGHLWSLLWGPLWLLGAAIPGYATLAIHKWFNTRKDVQTFDSYFNNLDFSKVEKVSDLLVMALTPAGHLEDLLYLCIHAIGLYALPVLLLPARFSWRVVGVASVLLLLIAFRFFIESVKPEGRLQSVGSLPQELFDDFRAIRVRVDHPWEPSTDCQR